MKNENAKTQTPATKTPCWREIEKLNDVEWLNECFERGFTIIEIARITGCSRYQVMKAMKHYGIDRRKIQLAAKSAAKHRITNKVNTAIDTMAQQNN